MEKEHTVVQKAGQQNDKQLKKTTTKPSQNLLKNIRN